MKKLIPAVAIILGWASVLWAAAPAPLTLHAVHSLTNAEANQKLPVAFEATVTYYRGYESTLFVQDGSEASFIIASPDYKLFPGDRVLIKGTTEGSFLPIVRSSSVTLLHHGALPKPVPATFDEMTRGLHDCELVSMRGVVRSVNLVQERNIPSIIMQILGDGGAIGVLLDSSDIAAANDLLDAEVEITGIGGGQFDGKMEMIKVQLHVDSLGGVKILRRASGSPWSLPVMPMDQLLSSSHLQDLSRRVRVQGTITHSQSGSFVILQSGDKSIRVVTQNGTPLQVGYLADATGFADLHDGFLTLTDGEIQQSRTWAPIEPRPVTPGELASSKHIFDLVSIEGQLMAEVREDSQDEYALLSDGYMFSAILPHAARSMPPMNEIPLGSRVRIIGVCFLANSNPYAGDTQFSILMGEARDITVVARPSPLNIHNLMLLVGLLLIIVAVVGARGWILGRRMRHQTVAMSARTEAEAELERRRSRILEDVNGNEPLAAILEQIAELVSFSLDGALCWCEIADGARLGNRPPDLHNLRIVPAEIPARSGPALGTLFAAFDAKTAPRPSENKALLVGTRLATLAIETRWRDADLRHRSEFDLLTDVHNRFSLEKRLNAQIDEAREKAGIFGLIYIDLDEFKRVNDLYGHRIGDLYLQEVTQRLKRQLRPGDLLARLGGDEFAVLLPTVRNRAAVEEVVRRLQRCFNDPFVLEGHTLQGAASFGIALYPEDSSTADKLLNAADAAMYTDKNSKR
jgi:diguanylate cyclase (GGDEF)-like protein